MLDGHKTRSCATGKKKKKKATTNKMKKGILLWSKARKCMCGRSLKSRHGKSISDIEGKMENEFLRSATEKKMDQLEP